MICSTWSNSSHQMIVLTAGASLYILFHIKQIFGYAQSHQWYHVRTLIRHSNALGYHLFLPDYPILGLCDLPIPDYAISVVDLCPNESIAGTLSSISYLSCVVLINWAVVSYYCPSGCYSCSNELSRIGDRLCCHVTIFDMTDGLAVPNIHFFILQALEHAANLRLIVLDKSMSSICHQNSCWHNKLNGSYFHVPAPRKRSFLHKC